MAILRIISSDKRDIVSQERSDCHRALSSGKGQAPQMLFLLEFPPGLDGASPEVKGSGGSEGGERLALGTCPRLLPSPLLFSLSPTRSSH